MKFGSVTTGIIADGLVFNMDAANRASYVPDATTSFNTIDLSNSGSLTNEVSFNNANKGIWEFDGSDDYIDCGVTSFLPSATNLTVSSWLKTSNVTDNQVVFGDNSSSPIFSFEYWGSNNRMYFEYGSGLYCYLTLNSVVSNNVWHRLALVYNSSGATNTDKIKIYINGVDKSSSLTYSGTIPSSLNASIGDFWIGNGQNYNSPFLGNIANVQIYNRTLSSTEVLHNYNALKGRFGLT